MTGVMSVPGAPDDPCQQTDPVCTMANGKAYAMCIDGKWADKCQCIVPPSSMPPASTPMSRAQCGDGTVTAPTEQCDGQNLNGASCGSLGMGMGTLLCNNTTCMYDTIMCRTVVTPPQGGSSGGAGTSGGGGGRGGS